MKLNWQQHRCLVTGGAGFGGSHLCKLLLEQGADVVAVDDQINENSYLFRSGAAEHLKLINQNVCQFEKMEQILHEHRIETIFHLAAQPIVPLSNEQPLETWESNVKATCVMLEAARLSSTVERFIFASSGACYGQTQASEPLPESQTPGPITNIYAASKIAAECAVRSYHEIYGLKTVACRFMNTYGPGDLHLSRIVPKAIISLINNEEYDFGDRDDGSTCLDFLNIKDMSAAYLASAENIDRVAGKSINFSTGSPVSLKELTLTISRLYDQTQREPIFRGTVRTEPLKKYLDASLAKKLVGWKPLVSLEEGLSQTLEWYREQAKMTGGIP